MGSLLASKVVWAYMSGSVYVLGSIYGGITWWKWFQKLLDVWMCILSGGSWIILSPIPVAYPSGGFHSYRGLLYWIWILMFSSLVSRHTIYMGLEVVWKFLLYELRFPH